MPRSPSGVISELRSFRDPKPQPLLLRTAVGHIELHDVSEAVAVEIANKNPYSGAGVPCHPSRSIEFRSVREPNPQPTRLHTADGHIEFYDINAAVAVEVTRKNLHLQVGFPG